MNDEIRPLRGCETLSPMLTPEETARQPTQGEQRSKGRRQGGQRFGTLNAFVDGSMATLRRNDIAVWLVLWRDTKDGIARTGQSDIARRVGATARTVRRAIGRLRRYGLLVLVYQGGLNRGTSAYRVESPRTDRGQVRVRKPEDKTAHLSRTPTCPISHKGP